MTWNKFAQLTGSRAVLYLKGNQDLGLTTRNAQKRLSKIGANSLDLKPLSWLNILWRQFISPFIYMLIAASVLSFFMEQWLEGLIILFFLLLNTALGFFQEYKSEKTANLLGKLITWKQRTWRDGRLQEISSSELVPGDIIVLEAGDRISADARLLEVSDLSIDESSLTGESLPSVKHSRKIAKSVSELSEANNLVFSGTSVVSGKAKAVVIATGKNSVFGKIAELSVNTKKPSSFAASVADLSSHIVKLVILTLVFVIVLNIIIKGEPNWIELLIFSIALAIGVIPEALPLVMTFSFSKGALALAKHKVIVKRLSSIEDLGNIEILCSDKTGTLTEGVLQVFDTYFPETTRDELISEALLSSGEKEERNDVFDFALEKTVDEGIASRLSKSRVLYSTPFDPKLLRNGALVKDEQGCQRIIVRGAPETLLALSGRMSEQQLIAARKWASAQGRMGRRVLAVSRRSAPGMSLESFKKTPRALEHDLDFLGMISFAITSEKVLFQL